ncbi:MAG: methyltransferase domain-containing protein [Sphingomonadaceae bacterium]|nr:methyltransferase domain-containing protein [Sphingomonadaceae bacterium]
MPFDRRLRRLRRDRAFAGFARHGFIEARIAAELIERLAIVHRSFSRALIVGYAGDELPRALIERGIAPLLVDPGFRFARAGHGIQCDEDRLPFRDASLDLVLAVGTLDTVNDLPGALSLIRRALRPDGLFLAGLLGAGSLPTLRRAMLDADMLEGAAAPRIHPQIDVRSAGDLLHRAGFALPVADGESLDVRYASLADLVADLRGGSNGGLLRAPQLTRAQYTAAIASFESAAREGKTSERFELIYLTAWAPGAT